MELPGLHPDHRPFKKQNLLSYVDYADKQLRQYIKNKAIENYVLCGLSFGYLVANQMPYDKKCLGVVALLPYLGRKSLGISKKEFWELYIGTRILSFRPFAQRFWETKYLHARLSQRMSQHQLQICKRDFDPVTYFALGNYLMRIKEVSIRKDYKQVLILSTKDEMLKWKYIENRFRSEVLDLQVYKVKLSHYPKFMTKEEVEKELSPGLLDKIAKFLPNV